MDGGESLLRPLRLFNHRYSAGLEKQTPFLPALLHAPGIAHPACVLPATESAAVAANVFGGIRGPELRLPGEPDRFFWRRLRLRTSVVARGRGAFLHSVADGGPQSDRPEPYVDLGSNCRPDSLVACCFLRSWP